MKSNANTLALPAVCIMADGSLIRCETPEDLVKVENTAFTTEFYTQSNWTIYREVKREGHHT